jgi:hypothetical protein
MPQLCSNERMDAMKPKVMEERLRLDRKMKNIRNTFNRSIQMIGRKSKTRVILTEVKRKATSPGQNPVRLKDSRKIKIWGNYSNGTNFEINYKNGTNFEINYKNGTNLIHRSFYL